MENEEVIRLGEERLLRSDFGPVSFGWVSSGSVVSWSGQDANDLLVGRIGEGFFLYPSKTLSDEELAAAPIQVWPGPGKPVTTMTSYVEAAAPADWNRDGADDLIVGGTEGFLNLLERKGRFPDLSFEFAGLVKDADTGLPFNVPYDNPNHPVMDNLGGYFDTSFFSGLMPVRYPSGDGKKIDLIIGDWAGNLWWLPDLSDGRAEPVYRGIAYEKRKEDIVSKHGRMLIEKHGCEYARPTEKLCDENGEPFLLGDGVDSGFVYQGGNARPALYDNNVTGSSDLLVLAGMKKQQLFYLQRVAPVGAGKPAFRNLGEVTLDGLPGRMTFHSKVIVWHNDGWNDLLISRDSTNIAVFRNKRQASEKPEFAFSHIISSQDVVTSGALFTEMLADRSTGKRYFLDSEWSNDWVLREINVRGGEVRLAPRIVVFDQDGPFRVDGETDPQLGQDWGFHRAARWNFDSSGRQHLIVGTDKGLLYLLIEEKDLGSGGEFRFRSVGPLRDHDGNVIRVHNRTCAAGIDLDGDGVEDLVLGGCTYQLGTKTDPRPGAGFYYAINEGPGADGLPRLAAVRPLEIRGVELKTNINSHVHVQAVDIDGDGEREIVLGTGEANARGRIFKVAKDGIALEYAGGYVDRFTIEDKLFDIDGDSRLELVFAGGEQGVGRYWKLEP